MGERIAREERHYDNKGYEDTPYAAPLALRAVRASVVRRRNPVTETADAVIERINDLVDGRGRDKAAPSPPSDIERIVEEPQEETFQLPRRKLGGRALQATGNEAA